jgi:sentrin-specific protease 1
MARRLKPGRLVLRYFWKRLVARLAGGQCSLLSAVRALRHKPGDRLALSDTERLALEQARRGPRSATVVECEKLSLTRADLLRFSGSTWLNDECVNVYLHLLAQRFHDIHALSSFFLERLSRPSGASKAYDFAGVRRWTRCDVFSKRLLLLPVNLGNYHWALIAVFPCERRLEFHDSLRTRSSVIQRICAQVQRWLEDEHKSKRGTALAGGDWPLLASPEAVQEDGSACGVFMLAFAARLAAGKSAPFGFRQADVRALRLRFAADCLARRHTRI